MIGREPEKKHNAMFMCVFRGCIFIGVDPNELEILWMFKRNNIYKKTSDEVYFIWCSVSALIQVFGIQCADCSRVLKFTHLRIITKILVQKPIPFISER